MMRSRVDVSPGSETIFSAVPSRLHAIIPCECCRHLHIRHTNFVKAVKMARIQIGRSVRRLRGERGLSQQALAARLGISASYLNLIEHDQRAVSGALLI